MAPGRRRRLIWGCAAVVVLVVVAALGVLFYFTWRSIEAGGQAGRWSYTDLKRNADAGNVRTLYIRGGEGTAVTRDGRRA